MTFGFKIGFVVEKLLKFNISLVFDPGVLLIGTSESKILGIDIVSQSKLNTIKNNEI